MAHISRHTKIDARDRALPREFEELVREYPPQAIHDGVAYDNAMEMIDRLMSVPKLSEGQLAYLDTLSVVVESYEAEAFAHEFDKEKVEPLRILRHLMNEHQLNASALGQILGERSLGSKILNGDRELSKAHIRILAAHFGVSKALFL